MEISVQLGLPEGCVGHWTHSSSSPSTAHSNTLTLQLTAERHCGTQEPDAPSDSHNAVPRQTGLSAHSVLWLHRGDIQAVCAGTPSVEDPRLSLVSVSRSSFKAHASFFAFSSVYTTQKKNWFVPKQHLCWTTVSKKTRGVSDLLSLS